MNYGFRRSWRACLAAIISLPPAALAGENAPASGAETGLYARAQVGALVLDLPEYRPFIETDSHERPIGFLDHYDAARRSMGTACRRLRFHGLRTCRWQPVKRPPEIPPLP